jgi:transposase
MYWGCGWRILSLRKTNDKAQGRPPRTLTFCARGVCKSLKHANRQLETFVGRKSASGDLFAPRFRTHRMRRLMTRASERATGIFMRRPLGVLGGNYSGPAPLFPTCQWHGAPPINALRRPESQKGRKHNWGETPGRQLLATCNYTHLLLINGRSCVCALSRIAALG